MATTRSDFTPMDEPEREPLTPAQVDALTEALNQLTERIGDASRQAAGQPAGTTASSPAPPVAPPGPWWFKGTPNYPGAPNYDPSFMPMDPAHRQWWARGTAGTAGGMGGGGMPPGSENIAGAAGDDPDPEGFSFVRSFWRRKAQRRAQRRAEREAAGGAGGGKPPWWTRYTDAAGGEDGPPEPEGWHRWRTTKVPTVTDASVPWNRKRKKAPWHWGSFTRKAGAWARMRFGKRGQRMAVSGLATAAGRLARGWSPHSALRAGVFAGSAAGGGAALATVGLATAAVMAARALNALSKEQVEYNRHLGQFSALMAGAVAQRDIQEAMRNRERGDRLSGSARRLFEAEQTEQEGTKEIGMVWERVKNEISTEWEQFKTALFFQLNEEAKVVNWIAETIEGATSEQKSITTGQWLDGVKKDADERAKRDDPRNQKGGFPRN